MVLKYFKVLLLGACVGVLAGGTLRAAEEAAVVNVTATGVGKDREGALKNALYRAVEQAVGSYLDQETLTKNEQVISDKILSVSRGFVEGYTELVPPREAKDGSGLFECKIEAKVKKTVMAEALKTAGVVSVKADGSSAWANQTSRLKNREDALELLAKLLPDLHQRLILCRLEDTGGSLKTVEDPKTGGLKVVVNMLVDVDSGWWNREAAPALDVIFTQLSLRDMPPEELELSAQKAPSSSTTARALPGGGRILPGGKILKPGEELATESNQKISFELPKQFWGRRVPQERKLVLFRAPVNAPHRMSRKTYNVAETVAREIQTVIGPTLQDFALKPVLRLALKDASGEVLEEVPINRIAEVFSGMIGGGSYGPFVNPTAFLGFLAEGKQDTITNRDDYPFVSLKGPVRVKLALDVSDDALKRVKSVSLESAMWGVDTRNSR